ncbi:MAG: binding-protein-dependent transport system inner rane component [Thermomicrobiales bacterium]|jgi:multiple sugar transport system permease protein|nr:binding-protein-dependent transport system inner rane component [Thermomicrobiales bacterium]
MATMAVRRPATSPLRRQETRAGLLFILPWIISLLVFTTYPTIATLYLSFTDYNILQPPSWIGLDNYSTMFQEDPAFWTAVRNSAVYALVSVPLKLVIAFGLALLLNMGVRGIGLYRTIFYLPTLVPPIAATIIFILLFSPSGGPINTIFASVGLRAPDWLNDPNWALPALMILGIWPLGVETLAFLAGLKEIPQDLLDAAAVDGAEGWQRLRHVIIPLISPVILFNLVIGVIYSFQVFTQALVIGGPTGEPLESTLMFLVLIYTNAFRYFSMGYAAALSVVLFAAVLLLTLLIFRTARSWVHYEGGLR